MRRALAAAVLTALVAGCAEPSGEPPTFSALEALEAAEQARPGLDLFSLRGLEGWRPGPRSDYLGLIDDGLPDGEPGDGRLSSWVASFVQADGLLEVQVFADGRQPAVRHHEAPYATLDETVYRQHKGDRPIDSDVAAALAAADPAFRSHVASGPGAGFLYTLARTGFGYAYDIDEAERIGFVGWPAVSQAWAVVHFPMDGLDAMAHAEVAADGTFLGVHMDRPLHVVRIADEQKLMPEPLPPPIEPIVHRLDFTVPRGAANLTGDIGVPQLFDGEYALRVIDPDGVVVFDSEESSTTYAELDIAAPVAGNWTVEANRKVPLPDVPNPVGINLRRFLTVRLVAEAPVLAGT